jgi:hypothetical protein
MSEVRSGNDAYRAALSFEEILTKILFCYKGLILPY